MTLGPLEYTVIGFEGNNFDGSIAREIAQVVENGTIALVDAVVFIGRDGDGDPVVLELDNKDDPAFRGVPQPASRARWACSRPRTSLEIAEAHPAEHLRPRPAVRASLGGADQGGDPGRRRLPVARTVISPEIVEEVSAELDA